MDTFGRAYIHRRRLRTDISPLPWLHKVALNLCYSRLGRRRLPSEPVTDLVAERLVDAGAQPEARAEWMELRQIVREGIAGLSSKHQAVVVLYYLEGRSLQETADELGLPLGTVKSRVHHALRDLRDPPERGQPLRRRMAGHRPRRGRCRGRRMIGPRLALPPASPGARGPRGSPGARSGDVRGARPPVGVRNLRTRAHRDRADDRGPAPGGRRGPSGARARRSGPPPGAPRSSSSRPLAMAPAAGQPGCQQRRSRRSIVAPRVGVGPSGGDAGSLMPVHPSIVATWRAAEERLAASPDSPPVARTGSAASPLSGRPVQALEGGALDRRHPSRVRTVVRSTGPSRPVAAHDRI